MKKLAALLLALGTVAGTAVAANAQGYYFNSRLSNPYYTNSQRNWVLRQRAFNRIYDRNHHNNWNRWQHHRNYRHDNGWHRGWYR